MFEKQVKQYIQEIRKRIAEEPVAETFTVIRDLAPEPLFRDLPCSSERFL